MQLEPIIKAAIAEAQNRYGGAPVVIAMSPDVHGALSKVAADEFEAGSGERPIGAIQTLYGCEIVLRNDLIGFDVVPR